MDSQLGKTWIDKIQDPFVLFFCQHVNLEFDLTQTTCLNFSCTCFKFKDWAFRMNNFFLEKFFFLWIISKRWVWMSHIANVYLGLNLRFFSIVLTFYIVWQFFFWIWRKLCFGWMISISMFMMFLLMFVFMLLSLSAFFDHLHFFLYFLSSWLIEFGPIIIFFWRLWCNRSGCDDLFNIFLLLLLFVLSYYHVFKFVYLLKIVDK